jgi:hypothetical protein
MTKNELNKNLCAVLTTLDECIPIPESTLYMALGCDMDKWNTVKAVLVNGKLATCFGYSVQITPAGHAMAKKINDFMNNKE